MVIQIMAGITDCIEEIVVGMYDVPSKSEIHIPIIREEIIL